MNSAGPRPQGSATGKLKQVPRILEAAEKRGCGLEESLDFPRWTSRSGYALSSVEGSRIAVQGMQGFAPCFSAAALPPPAPRNPAPLPAARSPRDLGEARWEGSADGQGSRGAWRGAAASPSPPPGRSGRLLARLEVRPARPAAEMKLWF